MSAKELHVIEKQKLIITLDAKLSIYESGYWPVSESDAVNLIGGTLYLHDTKAARSHFGGTVLSFRLEEAIEQYRGLKVFKFQATKEARGVVWKGETIQWLGLAASSIRRASNCTTTSRRLA